MEENISKKNDIPQQSIFKGIVRVGVFYFVGLSLFFIAGFIIITLRVADKQKVKVPSLIGKLYLDVHNSLTSKGFKIILKKAHSTEYDYGYILSQSTSQGKIVSKGSKLELLVNQSKNLIEVPKLIGINEGIAMGMLKNIPIGSRMYKLTKGLITRIPSEIPKGEIIAQYPLESTKVRPETPVGLLISLGPRRLKTTMQLPKLKGNHIEILKKMAYLKKMPIHLTIKKVSKEKENGIVLLADVSSVKNKKIRWNKTENVTLNLTIGRFNYEDDNKNYPNRLQWLDLKKHNLLQGEFTLVSTVKNKISSVKMVVGLEEAESENITSVFYLKDTMMIPFFQSTKETITVWNGYKENVLSDKILLKEEDNSKKKIFDDVEDNDKKEKEIVVEEKPVKVFEVDSLKI